MKSTRWKNRDALVTVFDEYGDLLEKTIIQRNEYLKRAILKPMAIVLEAIFSHIDNRGIHMLEAAEEGAKLARGLGLNEVVVKAGMLLHDAGQSAGSHEGEQMMNIISELLRVGFFHHSAKGVDVTLGENLIEKIIESIPEARNNMELQNRIKEEFWYILDIVVGHDGESTKKDEEEQKNKHKKYNNIEEAVLDKVSKANRTNKYKCQVETLEAQLSKPADVLAYLKTDMLDAFSRGIIKEFSDEYLELIGTLLLESYEETQENNIKIKNGNKGIQEKIRKDRIEKARNYINKIKRTELRETSEDIDEELDKEILTIVDSILNQAQEQKISIFYINEDDEEKIDEIANAKIKEFINSQTEKGIDKQTIASDVNKIRDYTKKMMQTRKRVVEKLMTEVQETLEDDYIQTTKKKWEEIEQDASLSDEERYKIKKEAMGFSEKASDIIYGPKGMKNLNYQEYVMHTKKVYQTNCLPKATLKMVEQCANALVKTGIIRDKFYDRSVLKRVKSEEVKNAMKVPDRDEEKYDRYKISIGIKEPGILKKARKRRARYNGKKETDLMLQNKAKAKIYKDIYKYTQRQGKRFARACEDVYYAISYTVRSMVKKALDSNYNENQYLPNEEIKQVYQIRKELADRFGEYNGIAITKSNLEKYVNELIEKEREDLELKIAMEMSINYLAGMPDERLKELLISTGNLSRETYEAENIINTEPIKHIEELSRKLTGEKKKETPESFIERIKKTHKVSPLFVIDDELARD